MGGSHSDPASGRDSTDLSRAQVTYIHGPRQEHVAKSSWKSRPDTTGQILTFSIEMMTLHYFVQKNGISRLLVFVHHHRTGRGFLAPLLDSFFHLCNRLLNFARIVNPLRYKRLDVARIIAGMIDGYKCVKGKLGAT
jgi:hypothetical protein